MSVWTWVRDFELEAYARGDAQRVRLAQIHQEAYGQRYSRPDHMLALMEEGRRLAQALNEPWWVLFYEHWCLETCIYYRDDYRSVIDLAVRTLLELRRPVHEQHPLRFSIHCNLVAAYLCVDPCGHADEIREALDYLEAHATPEGEEKYLLIARQHWFALEEGRLEDSRRYCLRWLAYTDGDPDPHLALHHGVGAHVALAQVSHRAGRPDDLLDYARSGEELAARRGASLERGVFLLWQALGHRHQGQEEEARRCCRLGMAQMARLGRAPDDSYYEALAAYHEQGGHLVEALRVRDQQLERLDSRGQLATEVEAHLQRLRLVRLLGQPLDPEMDKVRAAIARLRRPQRALARLDAVLQGRWLW